MIQVNLHNQSGGPGIFLERLNLSLSKNTSKIKNTKQIIISNPTNTIFKGKNLITRLDGCYFEKILFEQIIRSFEQKYGQTNIFQKLKTSCGFIEMNSMSKVAFILRNKHIRQSILQSKAIIFQSNFSKNLFNYYSDYFPVFNFKDKKSIVIKNGLDLKKFPYSEHRFDFPSIIVSGKYRPVKRWLTALRIFKKVKSIFSKARIIFLGGIGKDDYKKMREYAYKNKLSRVFFTGNVNQHKLPDFYSLGNIFLHPSYIDSCPNTVIEALCTGLPVVHSSNGGTTELVSDAGICIDENFDFQFKPYSNEEIIPSVNISEYAEAIAHIFNNIKSYKLKSRDARNNFDINMVANKYIKIANQI